MKTITVTVHDKEGLHARPAGVINKTAKEFESKITMTRGEKSADMKKIFAIMGMAVKCGDELSISCEGPDEDAAIEAMAKLFESV